MQEDLQAYQARFEERYLKEATFRAVVHRYLNVDAITRAQLRLARTISKSRYETMVRALLEQYTRSVLEDLQKLETVEPQVNDLDQLDQQQREEQTQLQASSRALLSAQDAFVAAQSERTASVQVIESQTQAHKEAVDAKAKAELEALEEDPLGPIKALLEKQLKESQLFETSADGQLTFSDQAVVQRLENIYLEELLADAEQQSGAAGLMGRLRRSYEGAIASFDQIEDLSELPRVDWMRSILLSRTRGYHQPQYPYLVTGKIADNSRAAVDTAIALDTSESMSLKGRFLAAQKTCLALFALMRELNPDNAVYLSHFNAELHEITTQQLIQQVRPTRTTRTDLALEWLLERTAEHEASLAYLITDGRPFGVSNIRGMTLKAAREFRAHPHIKLRIFLVDGNALTERTIREIGQAAGDDTKVATIDARALGASVLVDVANSFSALVGIQDF